MSLGTGFQSNFSVFSWKSCSPNDVFFSAQCKVQGAKCAKCAEGKMCRVQSAKKVQCQLNGMT